LLDFMCVRDFPELAGAAERDARVFRAICERTAHLICEWMRVGFVHGVMNTDNLSVLGLSIDYGPYGWLEDFDPEWTPNTTDAEGRRYAYGRQPQIAYWNLSCFAGAVAPLFADTEVLREGLKAYAEYFNRAYAATLAAKLGLVEPGADDAGLSQRWLGLLHAAQLDYTLVHRALMRLDPTIEALDAAALAECSYDEAAFDAARPELETWWRDYRSRVLGERGEAAREARMAAANPIYVPRNYLAQQAIDAAEAGDLAPLHALIRVLESPYEEQPGAEAYARKRPAWALNKPGCSMLSCSS
jgi:serine/tyrosine/threonine adenylyltransferase